MEKLSLADMNSLNAIAGYLRCIGNPEMAAVLLCIQGKATNLLKEVSYGIPEDRECNKQEKCSCPDTSICD